jgi:spore maturation protein CgeB
MRILLVGSGEFFHVGAFLARALCSLGYQYAFVDESFFLKATETSLFHKVAFRLLRRRPLSYWSFNRSLIDTACDFRPDVMLVTKGSYISPRTLATIKQRTSTVLINYATDDPFNASVSTPDLVAAIPHYDVYACTKRAIMADVRSSGCSHAVYVPFAYEPELHFPEMPRCQTELETFACDLAFAGGMDGDRIDMLGPLRTSIPELRLNLYGGYWNRHRQFRRFYRGFVIGRSYRLALGAAKMVLCLVRRANRDGHSMRSFEVPACGGFMLAERTEEHLELFEEDKEAAYFDCPEELVDKVRYYSTHDSERGRIAGAAHKRAISSKWSYRDRLLEMLHAVRSCHGGGNAR